LEKRYEEKRANVDEMYVKYEDALNYLPEDLKQKLEELNNEDLPVRVDGSPNE